MAEGKLVFIILSEKFFAKGKSHSANHQNTTVKTL